MGYTTAQAKTFIKEIAPSAQKAYKELGKVLPSVCIGMAMVESGAGTSKIMRKYNAFLGHKVGSGKTATKYWNGKFFVARTKEEYTIGNHTVIRDAFRAFDSAEQCVFNFYELLNTSLYKRVLSGVDYKTQMSQIKACGYMTSSTEVNSVISLIDKYDLTKYDTGVAPIDTSNYELGKTYSLLSDLYIRDNADGNKVKVDCLTANAKLNAKFDSYGFAILKKGTRVTCKEIKELSKSTWMRIPSGWVCCKNLNKVYIS